MKLTNNFRVASDQVKCFRKSSVCRYSISIDYKIKRVSRGNNNRDIMLSFRGEERIKTRRSYRRSTRIEFIKVYVYNINHI